jgi:hypothetical protein
MYTTNPVSTQADDDGIDSTFQSVAAAADTNSATAVSTLSLIQQARLSNQTRAVNLAVAVFGKDSAQATTATQAVTATTAKSARLAALTQQVTTPTPTVAATGWALHGRVYSSALAPQSGYAVFLVDAQKNYLSDYGYSYTDKTGYFLISYPGPAGSTKPGAVAAPRLFLQITDAKANPVLLSETAFVPVTGQATYQSVTLPAGDKKLGNLPADIRAVALPNLTTTHAPKQKATKSAAKKTDNAS